MKNYEVTFIVDPVLSSDEIKSTAATYQDLLKDEGCSISFFTEMGLKQLAYPIMKRNSGVYFCIEFTSDGQKSIPKMELAMRRDSRIMRYLTIQLDKYGVQYNQDKRDGKIGAKRRKVEDEIKEVRKAEGVKQDLTKIEGVGPKIAELLAAKGILTYSDLAGADAGSLKAILDEGGSAFTSHDPSSWSEQAKLAADGRWADLQQLQDSLQGGRKMPDTVQNTTQNEEE